MISWKKVKMKKNIKSFSKQEIAEIDASIGKKIDNIFSVFRKKKIKSFQDSKRIVLD